MAAMAAKVNQAPLRSLAGTITNNAGDGISVGGGAQLDVSNQTVNIANVSNCNISNNLGDAIKISNNSTRGYRNENRAFVSDCVITGNGGAGASLSGNAYAYYSNGGNYAYSCSNTLVLRDCTVMENGTGMKIIGYPQSSSGAKGYSYKVINVSNSVIMKNSGRGVEMDGSVIDNRWDTDTCTINSCEIKNNQGDGIFSRGYISLTDTVVTGNRGVGVSLVGVSAFNRSLVSGNDIGVQILPEGSGTITAIKINDIFNNGP